jgi:hypothetical protein
MVLGLIFMQSFAVSVAQVVRGRGREREREREKGKRAALPGFREPMLLGCSRRV